MEGKSVKQVSNQKWKLDYFFVPSAITPLINENEIHFDCQPGWGARGGIGGSHLAPNLLQFSLVPNHSHLHHITGRSRSLSPHMWSDAMQVSLSSFPRSIFYPGWSYTSPPSPIRRWGEQEMKKFHSKMNHVIKSATEFSLLPQLHQNLKSVYQVQFRFSNFAKWCALGSLASGQPTLFYLLDAPKKASFVRLGQARPGWVGFVRGSVRSIGRILGSQVPFYVKCVFYCMKHKE